MLGVFKCTPYRGHCIYKVAPHSIRTHTCGLGRLPKLLSPLVTLPGIDREEAEMEMDGMDP